MKPKHFIIPLILIAAIAFFFIKWKCNQANPDIIAAVDSVQYWKNKYDQAITSIKQREQDYNKISAAARDSVTKLHHTNFKLVNLVAELRLKGSANIPAAGEPVIIFDTIYTDDGFTPDLSTIAMPYSNQWYDALAYIDLKEPDSSFLQLKTTDSIRLVEKIVKEGGLFSRKTYLQFDAVNANPYNTINGLNIYKRPIPKASHFGIGPQVGVTYDGKVKPYVGVGISWHPIRF